METIRGRVSRELDLNEFKKRVAGYNRILLDLGTGDGRYVRALAQQHPDWFVIGLDACRENLREHSRPGLLNMLFLIAEAQHLPEELAGSISHLTINFPRGSLLESLMIADPLLMDGLAGLARPSTTLTLRLNSGGLTEAGWALEAGVDQISRNMVKWG